MSQTQSEVLDFITKKYPKRLLLNKVETSEIINISSASLDRLRRDGKIQAQMIGGKVLYNIYELARYLG